MEGDEASLEQAGTGGHDAIHTKQIPGTAHGAQKSRSSSTVALKVCRAKVRPRSASGVVNCSPWFKQLAMIRQARASYIRLFSI